METVVIALPSSGKTMIFNALTGRSVPVGDFSAAGRQVHLADVPVPDARVDRLSALYRPKKTTYATVLFRDPPLAYQENGALSPAGLGEVRKADAVTVVLRAFEDESVPHPLREVNPLRDLRAVLDSLVLADYEVAEKRLARLEKEAKRDGREYQVLKTIVERLGAGQLLGRGFFSMEDEKLFSGFAFLTAKPLVAVLMGSKSDWEVMKSAREVLERFAIPHEVRILSAHRTPRETADYAAQAESRGIEVIIAAAGGAAHLAGVVAAHTTAPVLGVPMTSALDGLDSLLSTVQMPAGIPVGTLGIGKPGATNAALLAVAILANSRPDLKRKLADFRAEQAQRILEQTVP